MRVRSLESRHQSMAECPGQAHAWLLSLPYKQRRRLMRWLSRDSSRVEHRLLRPWHRAVMDGTARYIGDSPSA
jgi:hypothetical protein